MKVTTLHFHIGSGYLTRDLGTLKEILEGCHWFLDQGADTALPAVPITVCGVLLVNTSYNLHEF